MTLRALLVGLLLNTGACSLIVDNRGDQCATNGDCAHFAQTFCDLSVRLCKPLDPPNASDDAAAAASQDAGSSTDACANTTFENACTNSACKPFNNRMRLKHLPLDGGLTPLVARDSGSPGPADAGKITANDAANDAAKDGE